MKNLHDSVPHPSYWKYLEHYSNSPSELFHTAFVELSTAHLSKTKFSVLLFSQVEIYAEQKCLPNIFHIMERYAIFNIRKTIKTGKKKSNHTIFIELFTAHLLEKN